MEQANEYRKDEKDIINEVFSNSPPYYMTKSGTSTGGWNAENNLKEECYDDFPPPYKGKQNCSSALTMKKQPN